MTGADVNDAFDRLHPVIQHHVVNSLGWPRLRPLQSAAIAPVLDGADALLLAPTAGGKTEAALFPVLTRMASSGWQGTSVLYVCPLRALLNNLEPRIRGYTEWLGRATGLRHGDTGRAQRQRLAIDRPDVLLTTPESLEAMLVSTTIDPRILLSDVRTVIIDEVHAFAGDDRGWHLLAVLERVARLSGRRAQRIGLSATVGNAEELLGWLRGGAPDDGSARVVNPGVELGTQRTDVQVDYVGSLANAAKVIASLHRGEKRLVFAESRSRVEELASTLRLLEVETFVSHSSLAVSERRRAEAAFAESRNCVIVSTSTLELGIDVGDLDRVIQIGAPRTVASFLQRLGRTGRRAGSERNMLLLATTDDELIGGAALLSLWQDGYVEPVLPPPAPRHVLAQQLLAMALQDHRVGRHTWAEQLGNLQLGGPGEGDAITDWMLSTGHLDEDSGMVFVGPTAERVYGHRHFMELVSIFTSAPQFTILHGRREIGTVDPYVMIRRVQGARVIALAGRSWAVTTIDWSRRRAYVEESTASGAARWVSVGQPDLFARVQAERRVVLGSDLPATLSQRARDQLPAARAEHGAHVDESATMITTENGRTLWWTWAGGRANAVIMAALEAVDPTLIDEDYRSDNRAIGLRTGVPAAEVRRCVHELQRRVAGDLSQVNPFVTDRALEALKFSDLLPPDLARSTLEQRLADPRGAQEVLRQPIATRV